MCFNNSYEFIQDGSDSVPFDMVNDDYCDCKDGSDEPGTAACPNGSFYCSNRGKILDLISYLITDIHTKS